jgi:hypothetical protein
MKRSDEVTLLAGGHPQIAKGDGDAPVQAYIAAMPGWKSEVGRRLDGLIVRIVPNVRKAVRWNSPFYGVDGRGWFLSYHCFTKYVKVVFLRGMSLHPLPPVESRDPNTRYFHIYENEKLDEGLLARWIKQASELPGVPLFLKWGSGLDRWTDCCGSTVRSQAIRGSRTGSQSPIRSGSSPGRGLSACAAAAPMSSNSSTTAAPLHAWKTHRSDM